MLRGLQRPHAARERDVAAEPSAVADGVWLVRGGFPRRR